MAKSFLQPGDRIVFMGDSITDCGRRGEAAPHGAGYVSMIRNLLIARYPEAVYGVVNRGISGNTVRDLDKRWEEDAIGERPDVLSIKIGINDVWRKVRGNDAGAVPIDEYEATYRRLLTQARERTDARLVLVEPYVLESDRNDLFRQLIDAYCLVVALLATEFNAVLVRTQAAFDVALAAQPSAYWANDRVHPFAPGHMVIARAWLNAVGYQWND